MFQRFRQWLAKFEIFDLKRPTRSEWVSGALFVVVISLFACMAYSSTDVKSTIFWFGGMILACETLLSFVELQGKRSAIFALLLRALTYLGAFFALKIEL